jgi:SAM-dependent methyltransferase
MDVVDLREFYQGPLGRSACGLIGRALAPRLSPRAGQTVLGLGFAHPYLEHLDPAAITLSFMLARQGVIRWPASEAPRAALVDDCDLPLLESVVDHAVVVHGLELSDSPLDMLQEVWRVLAPQGKVYLVVPNRRGLWSSSEASPFGHGQPFSRGQLLALLKEARFSVTWSTEALMLPPFTSSSLLRMAPAAEVTAAKVLGRFAGVMIVEAVKQVYAFSSGKRVRRLVPRFRPVLLPSPQPLGREPPASSEW